MYEIYARDYDRQMGVYWGYGTHIMYLDDEELAYEMAYEMGEGYGVRKV